MPLNGQDAYFDGEAQRKDHPIVLACNRDLATILPTRVLNRAEGYKAGQVIARDTSDQFYKAFSAISGGSFDSVGVLFESIGAQSATGGTLARTVFGGEVYKSVLVDFSSDASDEMLAREITDSLGTTIVKF